MEIIVIIALVTLALLFTGHSWRKTFKNNDQSDCTHDGSCRDCCGCSNPGKPVIRKNDNRG